MTRPALRCPSCRRPVAAGAPDFPFCSERCRFVDLGRWYGEDYRVSRQLAPEDGEELLLDLEEEESPSE